MKHYGCLLVPPKESGGGKGGAVGSQKAKVVEGSQQAMGVVGSQMKGESRKARKAITLGKSNMFCYSFATNGKVRTRENQGPQTGPGC